jgi:hypothetical protein
MKGVDVIEAYMVSLDLRGLEKKGREEERNSERHFERSGRT